jgi:hypothetical protein
MQKKKQNRSIEWKPGVKSNRRRGQAFVEAALVFLVFVATFVGALDFSQLLFTHQIMVERVRAGVRWGSVNAWDGTGDQIANVVRYDSSTVPDGATAFLGLTRANISVVHTAGTTLNPNDETIKVSIVDYDFRFISLWIARTYNGNYAALETAPMLYKQ